jgi:hypothetical protein
MSHLPPKLAAYAVALLSFSAVTGAIFMNWVLAGLTKASTSVSAVPATDALYLHALLIVPLFFLIGLLLGVIGTAIAFEYPAAEAGGKIEDAKPRDRGNGNG